MKSSCLKCGIKSNNKKCKAFYFDLQKCKFCFVEDNKLLISSGLNPLTGKKVKNKNIFKPPRYSKDSTSIDFYYELIKEEKKRDKLRKYYNYHASLRRAKIIKATPKWTDLSKIQEIYQNCPKNCEVDHIIPLQGKNVCGLHIPENLQYLPKITNRKKQNKLLEEYKNNLL